MTIHETERLRAVEENQRATNDKLDYLIERFDKFVEAREAKDATFVTKAEFSVAKWVVTVAISLVVLGLSIVDKFKSN